MVKLLSDPYWAYAMVTLCMQSLHNVFIMFYVAHFRSAGVLSDRGFYFGQAVYLVWNSVNDPLFGHGNDQSQVASRRSSALNRSAFFLPLAFMTVWTSPAAFGAAGGELGVRAID